MDVTVTSQARSSSPSSTPATSESKPSSDETGGQFKTFKHIPVRFYKTENLLALRLIKPTKCDNGHERLATLQDLIEDYFPNEDFKKGTYSSKLRNSRLQRIWLLQVLKKRNILDFPRKSIH